MGQKATDGSAMKILSLTLFLTPLLFHLDQVAADFGRIEHETRLGDNQRVDKDRRLVLDNDRRMTTTFDARIRSKNDQLEPRRRMETDDTGRLARTAQRSSNNRREFQREDLREAQRRVAEQRESRSERRIDSRREESRDTERRLDYEIDGRRESRSLRRELSDSERRESRDADRRESRAERSELR